MRQGQQNRRGRGRNRKAHHNPLTRSYESNGPDVKIRGTPSHIAEKYMSLARDALSSGDPVLAENYLQHAEHYNRIIMAFREQSVQQSGEAMNGVDRHSMETDDLTDEELDEAEGFSHRGYEPQPRGDGQSRYEERSHRQPDQGRPMRDRYQDPRGGYAVERQPRAEAPQPQSTEPPAFEPAQQQPRAEAQPRRRDRIAASAHEQPEFLRRPVRRPRRDANGGGAGEANGTAVKDESGD
ncbi:MAG: DUF4167 domain-containing protein [Hyphomicrobiaceae bacterium]|nr:DUF4167 domain-containing protein [Hyphomicrobiaceae bacterium]